MALLKSIYEHTKNINFQIIVVDNASGDGTAQIVQKNYSQIKIIKNTQNHWFRKANNQGIKISQGRYVMLLNPDTLLVADDTFEKMVKYMDEHARVGVLGPRFHYPDGRLQISCHRLPKFSNALSHYFYLDTLWPDNPLDKRAIYYDWDRMDIREVEVGPGACMLLRREAIEEAGCLDESCLIYYDESDLCQRMLKAGWKVVHYGEVYLVHDASHGGIDKINDQERKTIFEQSLLSYYKKYYGVLPYLILKSLYNLKILFQLCKKHALFIFNKTSR
jgi:GT2 family glycosyltransferase